MRQVRCLFPSRLGSWQAFQGECSISGRASNESVQATRRLVGNQRGFAALENSVGASTATILNEALGFA